MFFQFPVQSTQNRKLSAFTLVELLSVIAIVAILSLAAVFFTMSYVQWAQNVSDQRTLVILNDALTRYKCEGGNLATLTPQTAMKDVITALQTPVNWAGQVNHQFLQSAFTVPARSLFSLGSGSNYRFTQYNSYANEPGGVSSTGLAWGGEVQRFANPLSTHSSYTINLASAIPAGDMLVLIRHRFANGAGDISSITDTQGNTWTVDGAYQYTGFTQLIEMASCAVTHALTTSDSVTINYYSSRYVDDFGVLMQIHNAIHKGSFYANGSYTASPSTPGTVSSASSIIVGCIQANNSTYSSSSWNISGSPQPQGNAPTSNTYFLYNATSAAGTYNENGTVSPICSNCRSWEYFY